MTLTVAFAFILPWAGIGMAAFSLVFIVLMRSGAAYLAREPNGTLKRRIPPAGLAIMILFLMAVIGFFVLADHFGLDPLPGFWVLWALNSAVFALLFIFDTLVIDWLVLGLWRPDFLRLPDAMGRTSMLRHIRRSLPVGLVAGIALTGVASLISRVLAD